MARGPTAVAAPTVARAGYNAALGRSTAAQVGLRDADDSRSAASTVLIAAANFDAVPPAVGAYPRSVLEAAAVLEGRGDVAGARLLLEAVLVRHRPSAALRDALRRLGPRAELTAYRVRIAQVVALVGCPLVGYGYVLASLRGGALPVVGSAGLVVLAARRWWASRVRVPGLTRTDSAVWRAVRGLRYTSRTGTVRVKDQRGWFGLVALAGYVAGYGFAYDVVGGWLTGRAGVTDVGQLEQAATVRTVMIVFGCAAGAGAYLLARRARKLGIELRLDRLRRRPG